MYVGVKFSGMNRRLSGRYSVAGGLEKAPWDAGMESPEAEETCCGVTTHRDGL